MKKGIDRLIQIGESAAECAKADASGEVTKLLNAWIMQNWVRATLAFSGGMLALWASYSLKVKEHPS